MAIEVGKSRLEALGDVQETAELIRWNCDEVEKHEGFRVPMSGLGAAGDYYDVLRPYGVWAVISPFNFPMALSGGPSSGALVAGNAVVFEAVATRARCWATSSTSATATAACRRARSTYVTGRGAVVGDALWHHPDVNGITFTGSYEVGMDIYKNFATNVPEAGHLRDGRQEPDDRHEERRPRQGDRRRDASARSASAGRSARRARRVYVEREVYDDFVVAAEDEDRADQGRQPARARRLPGPDHQRGRARHLRGGGRGGAEERHDRHRRRAHHRRRPRPRASSSSRRSSRRPRTAGSGRRSCSCRSSPSRRSTSSTRRIEKANATRVRADRRASSARTRARSTSGSTGSRRASST